MNQFKKKIEEELIYFWKTLKIILVMKHDKCYDTSQLVYKGLLSGVYG